MQSVKGQVSAERNKSASAQKPLRNSGTNRKESGLFEKLIGCFLRFSGKAATLGVKGSSVQIRPARPNKSNTYRFSGTFSAQKLLRNAVLCGATAGLLSSPAAAYDSRIDGARWDPPARFDRPYGGELIVKRYHPRKLPAACANDMHQDNIFKRFVANFHNQRGCAFPRPERGKCWVYIIDRPAYETTPEAVLRHEIGHCNGWPSDHPE